MKRYIVFLILLMSIVSFASTTAFDIKWGNQATYSNLRSNTLRKWAEGVEGRLGGPATQGTGSIFYVDSNVSTEGDGSSWENAKDTLDEAINLCTANNGDVIYVAQGHTEAIIADGGIDADVAGITIIGCGTGDQRPTFTFGTAAAADMNIDADDVYVYNCIFQTGKADLVSCITVTNDDVTIDSCSFRDSTAGLGMITVGAADGDSDRFRLINCDFYQPGSTNDFCVEILKDMVGVQIVGNWMFGDFDEACVSIPAGGNACLDLLIVNNVISNVQTGQMAIEINGTSTTGVIADNILYGDTITSVLDAGACIVFGNLINTAATDLDAVPTWLLDKNIDHLLSTTTGVAADADLTTYAADGTVLSHIMTAGADTSDYQASTDSLEAISGLVTTADAVIDTVLVDTAELQPAAEKCIVASVATIALGEEALFTVAGGPIKIIEIVGIVTSPIQAQSTLINYNVAVTTPAGDVPFATDGTALEINGDAAGTLYTWNGVIANDLVATTAGVALGMASGTTTGLVVPPGDIELSSTAASTGAISFYMRYQPLGTGVTVSAP